jgi:hypothetical protein
LFDNLIFQVSRPCRVGFVFSKPSFHGPLGFVAQKRFGRRISLRKNAFSSPFPGFEAQSRNLVPQKTPSLRLPPQINEGPSEKCELPPRIFPALVTM